MIVTPINIDDYPLCASCGMPVEDFYAVELESSLYLVVECHQAIQTICLEKDAITQINAGTVKIENAFEEAQNV